MARRHSCSRNLWQVRPHCDDEGLSGLSEMMQMFADFRFESIKFFPFRFGASSTSNSNFDWRNIARIGLLFAPMV
jgi:hypothetical protein